MATHYLDSKFMGHAKAEDLIHHFETSTERLSLNKLVQVSMDGPNVNWRFYRLLQEKFHDLRNFSLLDIGSCGLHIVHGAFRDGVAASGWNIEKLQSGLYWLFKDTPARRDDYMMVTGSITFPLKFCHHRWLENLPVAQRALEMRPSLILYVQKIAGKVVPNPGTSSFAVMQDFAEGQLAVAKLFTFVCIAQQVPPFLVKYQSDRPLTPFWQRICIA